MNILSLKKLFFAGLLLAYGMGTPGFLSSSCCLESGMEEEIAKIEQVLASVDKAWETRDMEIFSRVFAHDQDIIVIGSDQKEISMGWKRLEVIQRRQFEELEKYEGSVKFQKICLDESGETARYYKIMDITFVTKGIPFHMEGVRETGVLKKKGGDWVIIQQHVSSPVGNQLWPFFMSRAPYEFRDYDASRKFSVEELKEDFDLLWLALEEAHAGLYRYTTKSEFDALFASIFTGIQEEMTEIEFFRLAAPLIEKIHCIHSSMSPSSNYRKTVREKGLFFPFHMRRLSGKLYVLKSITPGPPVPPGAEILSINGLSMSRIVQQIDKMLPSDGKNESYKHRMQEQYFPEYYDLYVEQAKEFSVEYSSPGKNASSTVVLPGISWNDLKRLRPSFEEMYKNALHFQVLDGMDTAVLTVKTFVPGILTRLNFNYKEFLKTSFREMSDKNIRNIIIDLRDNDGGSGELSAELLSYLMDKPFRSMRRIDTPRTRYSFLEYTDKDLAFNLSHPLLWSRDRDGRYLLKGNWGRLKEPKDRCFRGNVYVLINGMSISAASDFAALLHFFNRAAFIGEETGGAYMGNNSGDFINLTLPHTGLRIRIPIRCYSLAVENPQHPDRGVIPDYQVEPSISDVLQNVDRELEFTLNLIRQNEQKD